MWKANGLHKVKRLNGLSAYIQGAAVRWVLTLAWTAIAAALMVSPGNNGSTVDDVSTLFGGTEVTDAIGHVIITTILSLLWCWTVSLYASTTKTTRLILVGGIVWSFGAELSQYFVPERGASLLDLSANILGVLIGLMACRLLVVAYSRDNSANPDQKTYSNYFVSNYFLAKTERNFAMKTRQEAVEYLRQQGLEARERDWAMGTTIMVYAGNKRETGVDGIVIYQDVLYLYPTENGWAINSNLSAYYGKDPHYPSLFEAVIAAEEIASHYTELEAQAFETRRAALQARVPSTHETEPSHVENHDILRSEGSFDWNAPTPQAGKYLFRSNETMRQVWLNHGGKEEDLPKVDFSVHMVAALFINAGEYHSAPCILSIKKIDGRIKVFYGTMVRSWAMINPYSAKKVAYAEGEVEFIDTGEEDGVS